MHCKVTAFRPGTLATEFHPGAEGVAITGTAVADGMQAVGLPVSISGVHEAFLIRPAEKFERFLLCQPSPMVARQGFTRTLIQPDTGLDRPVTVLPEHPAVAGLDDDIGC